MPTVTLVGPAHASGLAGCLYERDGDAARALSGLGGGPLLNNLVSALLDASCSVELVTLEPELREPITLEGPRLRILAGTYRTRARHRGRDFFRVERRDVRKLVAATSGSVVNAYWTYEYALGALTSSDRPTIVTAQDAPLTILRYQPDRYRAMRTGMAIATRLRLSTLAANSPYLASAWRRQMLYRRPIPIVPNVVMPVATAPSGARRGLRQPTILDVTDAGRRKNVASLVRAMTSVLRSHPTARLRLVGPGLTQDSVPARLADRLGLGHAVDLVGPLPADRLPDEYSGATVFAHASLEESFGMTVGEAMSHGMPIVAGARAGAVPWLLDDGRAGMLVDNRHPPAIAAAVCRLLDDEPLRVELGQAAIERARSTFSPSKVASIWMELYDDVIRQRR